GLKQEGTSFIFISHKMPEIFAISDRYTVLRNGTFIGTGAIGETTPDAVTRMMVGETYANADAYKPRKLGAPESGLAHFTGPGFRDINLTVKRGEILALTGLKGAGSSELMQSMFGVMPTTGGTLRVDGKPLPGSSIHKAMKAKMAMLPSDRK